MHVARSVALLFAAFSLPLLAQTPGGQPQGGQGQGQGGQGQGGQGQGPGARGPGGRRGGPPQKAIELKNFTFTEKSFHSDAVGKDMPYGVYLPKDYDAAKDKQWPLVIWLHGMFEDHMRFQVRGGAPVLDQAVTEGKLPPCVFVLADGERTSMYIDAGDKRAYQQLIEKDLLEHVSQNYRVRQDRGGRALMGISMGGMATLRIGFAKPDLFGTIAVHSSAVFPEDPAKLSPNIKSMAKRFGFDEVFGDPIDATKWAAANPLNLAEQVDPKALHGLRIYFDAGTDDRFGFGETNKLLHDALAAKKVEHTWTLVQGGGHAWGSGFQESSLLASLTFVGNGFVSTGDKPADGKAPAKDDGKVEAGAKKDDGKANGGR